MQCREFKEVSEAYLSDELLVETNLQVFRHLENCAACRADFAARKALRKQLQTAVLRSAEFSVDPAFETRMRAQLKERAGESRGVLARFFDLRILVPAMSLVVIALLVGYLTLRPSNESTEIVDAGTSVAGFLAQVSSETAGNHKDCALAKMKRWEARNIPISENGRLSAEAVAEPLKDSLEGDVEVLHAHDCVYAGKRFGHVIVRNKGRVLSVFIDRSGTASDYAPSPADSIVSEQEGGYHVASFVTGTNAVFVVSDLSESENVSAARTLSNALRGRSSI